MTAKEIKEREQKDLQCVLIDGTKYPESYIIFDKSGFEMYCKQRDKEQREKDREGVVTKIDELIGTSEYWRHHLTSVVSIYFDNAPEPEI